MYYQATDGRYYLEPKWGHPDYWIMTDDEGNLVLYLRRDALYPATKLLKQLKFDVEARACLDQDMVLPIYPFGKRDNVLVACQVFQLIPKSPVPVPGSFGSCVGEPPVGCVTWKVTYQTELVLRKVMPDCEFDVAAGLLDFMNKAKPGVIRRLRNELNRQFPRLKGISIKRVRDVEWCMTNLDLPLTVTFTRKEPYYK